MVTVVADMLALLVALVCAAIALSIHAGELPSWDVEARLFDEVEHSWQTMR